MHRVIFFFSACVVVLILGGCERWYLDSKMEELCAQDGGIKVYETVKLPANDFNEFGEPLGRYWKKGVATEDRFGPHYKLVSKRHVIEGPSGGADRGEGQLVRWYHAIHRRADNKLLGESVDYSRSGGDWFTFGFQPSQRICPRPSTNISIIFTKEN